MKKNILMLIVAALLITISGCSPRFAYKDADIAAFNKELKSTYSEIQSIKVYIMRPTLFWEIKISDTSHRDDIFQHIVEFIKTTNIYEKIKIVHLNGLVWANSIWVSFYDKDAVRQYEGSYYSTDRYHIGEVDNFTTWYINEGKGCAGATNRIGTYTYQEP